MEAIGFGKTTIDSTTTLNLNPGIQAVFYSDSIPSGEWYIDETNEKRIVDSIGSIYLLDDGKFYDRLFVRCKLPHEFPFPDYRVLYVFNQSNSIKKIYTWQDISAANAGNIHCYVEKIACVLQAKDENGNWKGVDKMHKITDRIKVPVDSTSFFWKETNPKIFILPHESIQVMVKLTDGDFETEFRFKVLVNAPPDYPKEQYIYSNVFKGTILKSLLK